MTFSALVIKNTYFDQCLGKEGGCIACHDSLELESVTFKKCSATQSGAIFTFCQSKVLINISYCLACDLEADYFGFAHMTTRGPCLLEHSNLTNLLARQCVGGLEISDAALQIRSSIIFRSKANVHNGCIVTRSLESLNFKNTLFYECSHRSAEQFAGSVLLSYFNPLRSTIQSTYFIKNNYDQSYTISVCSGNGICFFDCIFTGNRENELSQNVFYTLDNTKFNVHHFNLKSFKLEFHEKLQGREVGYQNNIIEEYRSNQRLGWLLIHFISFFLSIFIALFLQIITKSLYLNIMSRKRQREIL